MIDRTDHDDLKGKKAGDRIDDDPHADHSLDPNEHYGQESDLPTADDLREDAGTGS